MICYELTGCNVDPVIGLIFVITLLVVAALLLKGDSMAEGFRGAVSALLKLLVRMLERVNRDDEETDGKHHK